MEYTDLHVHKVRTQSQDELSYTLDNWNRSQLLVVDCVFLPPTVVLGLVHWLQRTIHGFGLGDSLAQNLDRLFALCPVWWQHQQDTDTPPLSEFAHSPPPPVALPAQVDEWVVFEETSETYASHGEHRPHRTLVDPKTPL